MWDVWAVVGQCEEVLVLLPITLPEVTLLEGGLTLSLA